MDHEIYLLLQILVGMIVVFAAGGVAVYFVIRRIRAIGIQRAPKIFISYRRADSADMTGRIYDHLARYWGPQAIFMDVESIPAAVDFPAYLQERIDHSRVMLVVIGPHWLDICDPTGRRRLDNPADFVRQEVEAALQAALPIIPCLLNGVDMPAAQALPESLQPLAYRSALPVRVQDFQTDIERLLRTLQDF